MVELLVDFILPFCLVWLAFVGVYIGYTSNNSSKRIIRRKLNEQIASNKS
jgi:hypothetical protein